MLSNLLALDTIDLLSSERWLYLVDCGKFLVFAEARVNLADSFVNPVLVI